MHGKVASGIAALTLGLTLISIGRIHITVDSTVVGYDIGRLKGQESQLLEDRARLKAQIAGLTSREHLTMMTDALAPTDSNIVQVAAVNP
jgi:hypothetical protein